MKMYGWGVLQGMKNSSFLKIIDLSLEFSKENGSVTYLDSPTLFLIFFKEKGWAVFS